MKSEADLTANSKTASSKLSRHGMRNYDRVTDRFTTFRLLEARCAYYSWGTRIPQFCFKLCSAPLCFQHDTSRVHSKMKDLHLTACTFCLTSKAVPFFLSTNTTAARESSFLIKTKYTTTKEPLDLGQQK